MSKGIWYQIRNNKTKISKSNFDINDLINNLQSLRVIDPNRILHFETGSEGTRLLNRLMKIETYTLLLKEAYKSSSITDNQYNQVTTILKSDSESDQDFAISIIESFTNGKYR